MRPSQPVRRVPETSPRPSCTCARSGSSPCVRPRPKPFPHRPTPRRLPFPSLPTSAPPSPVSTNPPSPAHKPPISGVNHTPIPYPSLRVAPPGRVATLSKFLSELRIHDNQSFGNAGALRSCQPALLLLQETDADSRWRETLRSRLGRPCKPASLRLPAATARTRSSARQFACEVEIDSERDSATIQRHARSRLATARPSHVRASRRPTRCRSSASNRHAEREARRRGVAAAGGAAVEVAVYSALGLQWQPDNRPHNSGLPIPHRDPPIPAAHPRIGGSRRHGEPVMCPAITSQAAAGGTRRSRSCRGYGRSAIGLRGASAFLALPFSPGALGLGAGRPRRGRGARGGSDQPRLMLYKDYNY